MIFTPYFSFHLLSQDSLVLILFASMVSYNDYMNSEAWLIKKHAMKKRIRKANWCLLCQACWKKDCYLEVHHRRYDRFWDEKLSDLFLVCKECHDSIHAIEKKNSKTTRSITAEYVSAKRKELWIISRNLKIIFLPDTL